MTDVITNYDDLSDEEQEELAEDLDKMRDAEQVMKRAGNLTELFINGEINGIEYTTKIERLEDKYDTSMLR
jgi:hypothetical protein